MYQHKQTLGALALLTLTALPLAAQGRVEVYETRPSTRGRTLVREMPQTGIMTASRRAVIGITLNLRPSSSNDSVGATVAAVTPGGPAARAGIVSGDIIIKFDGTALVDRARRTPRSDDDEEAQSAPGLRLLELTARQSPGDTVAVEWRHERQRKTASIVMEESPSTVVYSGEPGMRFYTEEGPGRFKFQMGEPRGMAELEGRLEALRGGLAMTMPDGGMGGNIFMRFGGPLGGVQFAPLNADLGRYFGTTEGILVLETPDSSANVDLKGGDVIVSIGDRKPTSVEHLFRILGSYQSDEMVRFDIMRDRRRMTIEAKAEDLQGERPMRGFGRQLMPSETPAPMRTPDREAPVPAQPRRTPRPGA